MNGAAEPQVMSSQWPADPAPRRDRTSIRGRHSCRRCSRRYPCSCLLRWRTPQMRRSRSGSRCPPHNPSRPHTPGKCCHHNLRRSHPGSGTCRCRCPPPDRLGRRKSRSRNPGEMFPPLENGVGARPEASTRADSCAIRQPKPGHPASAYLAPRGLVTSSPWALARRLR
jgi:hypothetical protein